MRCKRLVAGAVLTALLTVGAASTALGARKHRLQIPPRPAFPRALSVDETEYVLTPSRNVVSSGRVRLNVYNRGMDDHDVAVFDTAGTQLGTSGNLLPGEAGEVIVTLPPGEYRVVCSLFAGTPISHELLGMKFALTVQTPPTSLATHRAKPR